LFHSTRGSPFYLGRVDDEVKSTSRRTRTNDKERFLEFTEVYSLEHRGNVFVLGCKRVFFAKFYLERRSGRDKREDMCNELGRAEGEVRAAEV
jgi:hypothetical protein